MKISFWVGRSAPPDSTRLIAGSRFAQGDLVGPQRPSAASTGCWRRPDRRVVGADQALDAAHHADAGDDAGADGVVAAPRGERRQLQERRVPIEQQLDALAGQQLAAGVVALDVLRPAARDGLGVLGVQLGELLQQAAHSPQTRRPGARRWCARWSCREPQSPGGQAGEDLGRAAADADDAHVAVLTLDLAPRIYPMAPCNCTAWSTTHHRRPPRCSWRSTPGRPDPARRRRSGDRRRGCTHERRRCAGPSRPACSARPAG